MTAHDILTRLMEQMKAGFPQADFREAKSIGAGTRLVPRLTAVGEVGMENAGRESWKARLDFIIYLPRGIAPEAAEPLISEMARTAEKEFPQFSAMNRGTASLDKAAGLQTIPCSFSFSSSAAGGESRRDKAVLGGIEHSVSGWRISISEKGEDLISVGEDVPFAVKNSRTEYTVELEGLDTAGLERLTGFTAELGDPPEIYEGCRWKSLSAASRKGTFVSRKKREG